VGFEQGGYTRYCEQEKSRVAEIQKTIEVLQREKQTLPHTAGNCGGEVARAAKREEKKRVGVVPVVGRNGIRRSRTRNRRWNCVDLVPAQIQARERMSAEEKGAGSKR
jgi:hypothetical protein